MRNDSHVMKVDVYVDRPQLVEMRSLGEVIDELIDAGRYQAAIYIEELVYEDDPTCPMIRADSWCIWSSVDRLITWAGGDYTDLGMLQLDKCTARRLQPGERLHFVYSEESP